MKLAILYSGSIRTLAETLANNLEYFSFANEIDLYFSVWDHVGYSDRLNAPDYIMSKRITDPSTIITQEWIKKLVGSRATVKRIKIEKYDPSKYNFNILNGVDNIGLHAQYYKIKSCFDLVGSNEYDAMVRMRCDVLLNNKIDKEYLYRTVYKNHFIFNKTIWHNYEHNIWDNPYAINEMIWISNKRLMRQLCNIYGNASKINKIISEKGMVKPNFGENITYMHLQAEKLIDRLELYNFDYTVLR